jgi:hypothetical protein
MAKQTLADLATMLTQLTAINGNFTELYNTVYLGIATKTASYTLGFTDVLSVQKLDHASTPIVATVPANSSVAFPIGTEIIFMRYGAAACSFVAAGGVTIRSKDSALKISSQYETAILLKIGTDEWLLAGAIST